MNKRPKITITEENKECVISTLEKFGGVDEYDYKSDDTQFMEVGEVYYIEEDNSISCSDLDNFHKYETPSNYYEVDPIDYLVVRSKSSEIKRLKSENETLRECLKKFVDWKITELKGYEPYPNYGLLDDITAQAEQLLKTDHE